MISQEMLRLGQQSSVIRAISEYGRVRKNEIGAENVFDFSLGNPSIPAPYAVEKAMVELIKNTPPCQLHGYTSSAGDLNVRKAIARHIEKTHGAPASAELIYMTCGAAASLTCTLHALCNSGDEVVVPSPFFPEYRVFIEKTGAKLVEAPCLRPSFALDLCEMAKRITEKTKVVMLNSPNNPTGAVYSEESLRALAALMKEKEKAYGTEIYLLADEPYRELYYGKEKLPWLPSLYDRTVVAYSFSKSLSLPGERIGYILVSPTMPERETVFAAVCGAGRSLGFVCAPSLWQKVVEKCIGLTGDVEQYRKNRDALYGALSEMGYVITPPDGAFYLFVQALEEDAGAFCEKAKKYELLLVPGDSFGAKGFVRIAYCVDFDTIRRSLPAFRSLMEEYKK